MFIILVSQVLIGSALKNTGVQLLLDAVVDYLPSPNEARFMHDLFCIVNVEFKVKCVAFDVADKERKEIAVDTTDSSKPFIGMAFKVEKNQFGQLTYFRTYQGMSATGLLSHMPFIVSIYRQHQARRQHLQLARGKTGACAATGAHACGSDGGCD